MIEAVVGAVVVRVGLVVSMAARTFTGSSTVAAARTSKEPEAR
jgi:hypothetical protein